MEVMMAVHSSFRLHDGVSFNSQDTDRENASFNTSVPDLVSQNSADPLSITGPLSLPEFVFPPKKPTLRSSSPPTSSRRTGRRPLSLYTLSSEERRSFQDDPCISRPLTSDIHDAGPVSPRTSLNRHGFHVRGASGLVSSEVSGKSDTEIIKSSTEVEIGSLSATNVTKTSRIRGHAHRRSAAISTSDLSIILTPNCPIRVGRSLPNSPKMDFYLPSTTPLAVTNIPAKKNDNATNVAPLSSLPKALRGTRVEFSDDVQIIPRPLSMSSVNATSSSRSENIIPITLPYSFNLPQIPQLQTYGFPSGSSQSQHPHTAEPTTEREEQRRNSHEPKRSESLPQLKPDVKFSSCSDFSDLPKARPTSLDTGCKDEKVECNNFSHESELIYNSMFSKKLRPSRRPSSKKQKKVKTWAGSILSRRPRQRSQKNKNHRRSPTPPHIPHDTVLVPAVKDHNALGDSSSKPVFETDFANWKPRKLSPQDEPLSPVIDLDAALGPFNTPTSNIDEPSDYSRRGLRKKAMHSAAGLGGFSGPGMHYHRRAESAPEFENPWIGFHRLGSNSTMEMEDVFEEDEDENWEDARFSENDFNAGAVEAGSDDDHVVHLSKTSSLQGDRRKTEVKNPHPEKKVETEGQGDENQQLETPCCDSPSKKKSAESLVKYVDFIEELDTAATSESSVSEISRPEISEIPSVSLQLPYQSSVGSLSTTQSPFPSPLSPFSYDNQFLSTAPSSTVEDQGFESLLLGEPGPELRMSVDDLLSSTSSDSTMTRQSSANPIGTKPRLRDGQRSASFSAPVANRKRSSIASLSRLISSSHGERSKLAIESRAPSYNDGDSQHKSATKGKRISRLMKFWKKSDDSN